MAARDRDDDDDEDDDDDIGEYVVEGKELRRVLKRAARRPVAFAFCPVAGDETTWFASHKKKSPSLIAKKTKKASGQAKVAFGTFMVKGKLVILNCVDLIPNLAQRVKKHLAREGIRRSVRALDIDGVEFDADVEDLGDGPEDDGDLDDAGASGDEFAVRLDAVQGPVLAARGENGNRLRQMLAGIFAAQDKGNRGAAEAMLRNLERQVRQVMNSAARPLADAPAETTPPVDGKAQVALARSVRALRERIERLGSEAEDRLLAALAIGARQIKGGDLIGAAETISKVTEALDRVEARENAAPS